VVAVGEYPTLEIFLALAALAALDFAVSTLGKETK
jgi:hypothetical protein